MKFSRALLAPILFTAAQASLLFAFPPPPPAECTATTIQGSVLNFRYSPRGEVDGFFVNSANGTVEVKFPAHLGGAVTAIVSRSDQARVTGCGRTGPEGDYHVKASTIANLESGQSVTVGSPPPPTAACTTSTREGTLADYRYAHRGEVDGFFLRAGSEVMEVRFPPHISASVTAIVVPGSQVRVTGCVKTGPEGDVHLKAESIVNVQNGASVTVAPPSATPLPPPPPGPKPTAPKPAPRK